MIASFAETTHESFAGHDAPRLDDDAKKRNATADGLNVAFLGVEGKVKASDEFLELRNDFAEDVITLSSWHNKKEIIYIAAVSLDTEMHSDKTIELIEIDVG